MTRLTTQERGAISIRAKVWQQGLIDPAAERQDGARAAACGEAEDVLLDQTFFTVTAKIFKKFQDMRTNPLLPTDKLRRLLKTKAPWDIDR